MRSYFLKRLLLVIPTLLGISIVSFILIHLAPGDPAELKVQSEERITGDTAQQLKETRELYGLDQPLYIQYFSWLKRIVTLDFGYSLGDHRPIIEKIKERLPVTVKLSGISILLAYLISIPIGVYSATHRHSIGERILTIALFGLYSIPNFWLATMAIIYLGGGDFWDVFPVFGLASSNAANFSLWQRITDQAWHLVLPVACLTYYTTAVLSRYMRTSMLEIIRQDFIRTARAKGLSERLVIYRHAVRNSLIPIITLMADLLPALVGGSVVIETLFGIQGMGQLSYQAIFARDYPLLMALFTMSALVTLGGILIADFLYVLVDPRISYGQRAAA
ncbi:MAG TPA: ABC transporter permease [Terriglobia bacterium]|nr:ABC transporter permease [Terriglobia bacterium]